MTSGVGLLPNFADQAFAGGAVAEEVAALAAAEEKPVGEATATNGSAEVSIALGEPGARAASAAVAPTSLRVSPVPAPIPLGFAGGLPTFRSIIHAITNLIAALAAYTIEPLKLSTFKRLEQQPLAIAQRMKTPN